MLTPGNYQQLSLATPAMYETDTISHQTQETQGSLFPDGNINLHLRVEGKNQWRFTPLTHVIMKHWANFTLTIQVFFSWVTSFNQLRTKYFSIIIFRMTCSQTPWYSCYPKCTYGTRPSWSVPDTGTEVTNYLGQSLSQCHFAHHKSHTDCPGIEVGYTLPDTRLFSSACMWTSD